MNDDTTQVFAAMGSALARWAITDKMLTLVYGVAVNPRKPTMAAASIWRVTGHNLKVEMTEAALLSAFVEYPKGDSEPTRLAWKKAKLSMQKAASGRNDLSHAALYGLQTDTGRMSVLQKDREKFHALRAGSSEVRYFDVDECQRIESLCFDATIDLARLLRPLDEFWRASRIVMKEDEAFPQEPFFDSKSKYRRRREATKRKRRSAL